MKKIALVLIIATSSLIALGLRSRIFPRKIETRSDRAPQERLASLLTEREERDLQKLVPLALMSIKEWFQPINCLEREKVAEVNFAEIVKHHEGQGVEMKLDIRENSVIVYLDAMRTYLLFPRLHALGLAPARYDIFCEKSYADKVAAQKQYPYWANSKKSVRDDPRMTALVDQLNEKYPAADYDKVVREEVRRYQVPVLTPRRVEPLSTWSDEKRHLYERILEVARKDAIFQCKPGKRVTMFVPDFEIGDPKIDLLLEAPGTRTTIEWLNFSRDVSSGEYTAELAKNFGLPDEIEIFSRLIKRKQVSQVSVECPAK